MLLVMISDVLAVMLKRSYINEDPFVNILDNPGEVMYAEVSYPHHTELVRAHGGMDVFIKIAGLGRLSAVCCSIITNLHAKSKMLEVICRPCKETKSN